MRSFIIRSIKLMGASLILKEYEVKSYLTFYRLDFRDKFGNYVVLEIFHNDTDLFTKDLKYIGEGNDYVLSDSIRSMCTILGKSILDYRNYKGLSFKEEDLNLHFSESLVMICDSVRKIECEGFIIRKVDLYTSPTMMMFIHLNYNKKRIKPIKIFIGEGIHYVSDLDTKDLINKIRRVLYV